MASRCTLLPTLLAVSLFNVVTAHEHHNEVSHEEASAPVDMILWLHILLQALVWGILFPVGMVLGITRSRWHVPLQVTGYLLTAGGYILGHTHGGRMFKASAHGTFASILFIPIAAQFTLGVYLKLHIHEQSVRPYAVKLHGILGKAYPILAWVQMLFGAIVFRGYCRDGDLGQCLAHYIMGSGFIAYGVIIAIMLFAGEAWIRRSGRSPEWWDSWVIMLWGIVNTFTEHRGDHWSHKDMQHTIMGVLWWAGGLLGVFLSRKNQRTVVPAIIIILTGWGMSNHAQALMISTMVHSMFGYTLMLAGLARLIEVCFVAPSYARDTPEEDNASDHTLRDSPLSPQRYRGVNAFLHLTPFLLIASGILFISATDEEMKYANSLEMDHVTYILIMFSFAFFIYFITVLLIHLSQTTGRAAAANTHATGNADQIEMSSSIRNKWYARVPSGEPSSPHVLGEDEER